jgi:hypothetical protein
MTSFCEVIHGGTLIAQLGRMMTRPTPTQLPGNDPDVFARIHGEFREMPGLKLTLPQASRLFHLDLARCELALKALVELGALYRHGDMFATAGSGRRFV